MEPIQLKKHLSINHIDGYYQSDIPRTKKFFELILKYRGEFFTAVIRKKVLDENEEFYTSAMESESADGNDLFESLSCILDEDTDVQEKIKEAIKAYDDDNDDSEFI